MWRTFLIMCIVTLCYGCSDGESKPGTSGPTDDTAGGDDSAAGSDAGAADSGCDSASAEIWYPDVDQDGYGADEGATRRCAQPEGYVSTGGDCDDGDPAVYPSEEDPPDGVDNDCDGSIDEDPIR